MKQKGRYLRIRRKSRTTGTIVCLWDSHAPGSYLDSDGGRWVTTCEDHGTVCNHRTYALAISHLPAVEWCEECHPAIIDCGSFIESTVPHSERLETDMKQRQAADWVRVGKCRAHGNDEAFAFVNLETGAYRLDVVRSRSYEHCTVQRYAMPELMFERRADGSHLVYQEDGRDAQLTPLLADVVKSSEVYSDSALLQLHLCRHQAWLRGTALYAVVSSALSPFESETVTVSHEEYKTLYGAPWELPRLFELAYRSEVLEAGREELISDGLDSLSNATFDDGSDLEMYKDLIEFYYRNLEELAEFADDDDAGYLFYHARNGSGIGFADCGDFESLQDAAVAFGPQQAYYGDDHLVHVYSG